MHIFSMITLTVSPELSVFKWNSLNWEVDLLTTNLSYNLLAWYYFRFRRKLNGCSEFFKRKRRAFQDKPNRTYFQHDTGSSFGSICDVVSVENSFQIFVIIRLKKKPTYTLFPYNYFKHNWNSLINIYGFSIKDLERINNM